MRRLALVAEGSSRGGSSLQTEVLLSRVAITACCQLQVVPNLISLSSLLVVLCSSSENRSCVCLPALSCRYPTIPSAVTPPSHLPLHYKIEKLGEQTAFVCCQASVHRSALPPPADPGRSCPSVSALLTSYRSRALLSPPRLSFALAQSYAVEVNSRRSKAKRPVYSVRHQLAHPSVSRRATLRVRTTLQHVGYRLEEHRLRAQFLCFLLCAT
ncbi:hypothetical protein BU25DRAFT_197464 [Macroventuria anomochaeta]|uniref:Uncharacterized protein n=1 Tax=Macroventuria anomochaeta TaxID=301207 RepID=A0ACB6SCV9_9PLEO|nr:uncharacterized protein BU25DRAFT_197464 [Macroventuria anomochaeta]KAF2631813.1 hypothetical protein BU25DRAFT_197464 [Macroventuria anomochaeta]